MTGGHPAGAEMTSHAINWRHDVGFSQKSHNTFILLISCSCEILKSIAVSKMKLCFGFDRWPIRQVPEWRHAALHDVMTSDFDKNLRICSYHQYLSCVTVWRELHQPKWNYSCFHFLILKEICRNCVHLLKKHPP